MKNFQEFLEQSGSPTMSAKQQMYNTLGLERSKQAIKQSFWRQRHEIRRKSAQDSEMHDDMERRKALP